MTESLPLLQEYFYNDGERLAAVLGEQFVRSVKIDDGTRRALGDWHDDKAFRFDIAVLRDAEFINALTELTE